MLFPHSIRWRLQIWHGFILLAVLSGFGLTAWQLEQQRILTTANERIQERFSVAVKLMRQAGPREGAHPRPGPPPPRGNSPPRDDPAAWGDPGGFDDPPGRGGRGSPGGRSRINFAAELKAGEPPGGTTTVWRRDGALFATTTADRNPPRPEAPDDGLTIARNGSLLTLIGSTPPGEIVAITRSIAPEVAALRRSGWQLAGAGTAVMALGLVGGWWAAGRSLRPIATISATAARLSAGNLGERLSVEDTQNELGHLASILNAMLGRLDTSFTQQTRFISDAAHELRTPVSVMLTQTQTALRRERPAEEYRQSLEACQRAATRMRQLIESLLALARLDAGDQPMKRLRFDLARAAAEQAELLTPLAAARNITLFQDLTPLSMEGDPDYLTLVVANLLTNAIHYNRDGGEVRLTVKPDDGSAVLTVTDTGEGMTETALQHIFGRFYRADQSRSLPAGRTGLGLAITKSIVEAHQGTINVASTPGVGTTFTVRIPSR